MEWLDCEKVYSRRVRLHYVLYVAVHRVLKNRTQVPTTPQYPPFEYIFSQSYHDKEQCQEWRRIYR